eukprot:COSAG05_NODE_929_length_6558_cov_3.005264_10_plen_86_part_00
MVKEFSRLALVRKGSGSTTRADFWFARLLLLLLRAVSSALSLTMLQPLRFVVDSSLYYLFGRLLLASSYMYCHLDCCRPDLPPFA